MLYYYRASNSKYTINFSSEEAAAEAIEKYKEDIMQEGDTIIDGSETITYTLQPQTALTVIDQSTGEVKAIVGGRGDKTANKTLNRATDTTRQPGSTFKIIASYSAALDAGGLTLASVQDDAPYTYGTGEGASVSNYDHRYRGFTTLREAITDSINIVTVKTLAQIGPSLGYDYIRSYGITTVGIDESGNESLALGGLTNGVTNLELTAAYATIANGGTYVKPKFYTRILDHDGNVLIDNTTPETHTVLKETTAWLLTSAMEDVMTQGTGTPAYFGSSMAQAGKSGTTSDSRDVLFAGFTPYYTCVVWGGYDDNASQTASGTSTNTTYPKTMIFLMQTLPDRMAS
jgi:penicillin-binding protein 1A